MKALILTLLIAVSVVAKPATCRVTRISQYERNVWVQCDSRIYKFPQAAFRRLPRVGQRFSEASVLAVQRQLQKAKGCDEIESRRPVPDRSKP